MKKLRFLRELNNHAQIRCDFASKMTPGRAYLPGNTYTPDVVQKLGLDGYWNAQDMQIIVDTYWPLADSRWSLPEITPVERYTREMFSPTNLAAASCRFIYRNMLSLFTATRVQPTDSATTPIAGHWFLRFSPRWLVSLVFCFFPLFFPARGFRVVSDVEFP